MHMTVSKVVPFLKIHKDKNNKQKKTKLKAKLLLWKLK